MQEICNEYRVKQVSERRYPANFIEKTDEFINLPTGFGKSLIYQALPLFATLRGTTEHYCCFVPGESHERSSYKAGKYLYSCCSAQ